jgi:hypothetical protein
MERRGSAFLPRSLPTSVTVVSVPTAILYVPSANQNRSPLGNYDETWLKMPASRDNSVLTLSRSGHLASNGVLKAGFLVFTACGSD